MQVCHLETIRGSFTKRQKDLQLKMLSRICTLVLQMAVQKTHQTEFAEAVKEIFRNPE